jgi:transposase
MRSRKTIVPERAYARQSTARWVLETATVKLASVETFVLGKSGRESGSMLCLAVKKTLRCWRSGPEAECLAKLPELRKALDGRVHPHPQVLLTRILAHIDFLEESLVQLQQEMEQYLDPFEEAMELVQSVVGIKETAAASLIAEMGTDMTRFASDKHLASWAGVCPGNKQSGGKRLSGKTTKGNPYLRAVLFEVAWAIAHTKDTYLSAFYHRLASLHGKPKAIMALAHKVLVIISHLLRTKKPYTDLGADYFDQQDRAQIERHHIHRLEQLGYTVTLMPKEAAEHRVVHHTTSSDSHQQEHNECGSPSGSSGLFQVLKLCLRGEIFRGILASWHRCRRWHAGGRRRHWACIR